MSTLREEIEDHLKEFQYQSSRRGVGMRHLLDHVRTNLAVILEPFIREQIDIAIAYAMEGD